MSRPVYRFVEALMRDLSQRENMPSPTGGQLDRMRDGTMGCSSGDPFRHERASHRTAVRLMIWHSLPQKLGLRGEVAQRAIVLKSTPVGWEDRFREVPEGDLVLDTEYDPPTWTTKQGEEIALEEEIRRPPKAGHRVVRGSRPTFATNAQIAAYLGISERKLRTLLGEAYATLESHELFEDVS